MNTKRMTRWALGSGIALAVLIGALAGTGRGADADAKSKSNPNPSQIGIEPGRPFSWREIPDLRPQLFERLSKRPWLWPNRVTLRMDVSVKVVENGVDHGSITLSEGTRWWVLKVEPDGTLLIGGRNGTRFRVDQAATNFIESLR